MKLLKNVSTLAVAVTLSLGAAETQAKDFVLKPVNQKIETQACYVAATEGLSAVKVLLKQHRESYAIFKHAVTCNGLNLADFAIEYNLNSEQVRERFELENTKEPKQRQVSFVATNTNVESQLCIDAVTMGENAAREKHAIQAPIRCNSRRLTDFISTFKNKAVVALNSLEQPTK